MADEASRVLKLQHLAESFESSAARSDSVAAEFRTLAGQKFQEFEEHSGAPELREHAERLMRGASTFEDQAEWSRRMAGRFWRRAEIHRARISPGS